MLFKQLQLFQLTSAIPKNIEDFTKQLEQLLFKPCLPYIPFSIGWISVLDEVDAPLDDANVGRFCNLVKELSEQVQFIYITHNKLAMTMATDLLGVTMPEPGTSKLVTVNLEEAAEYGLVAEA